MRHRGNYVSQIHLKNYHLLSFIVVFLLIYFIVIHLCEDIVASATVCSDVWEV